MTREKSEGEKERETILELITQYLEGGYSPVHKQIMRSQLRNLVGDEKPSKIYSRADVPMSRNEFQKFGNQRLPERFKKYAGKLIDEVPYEYLAYLVDRTDWDIDLIRYLRIRAKTERNYVDEMLRASADEHSNFGIM
jgi:uncharacterized protein (DUF3820 family)